MLVSKRVNKYLHWALEPTGTYEKTRYSLGHPPASERPGGLPRREDAPFAGPRVAGRGPRDSLDAEGRGKTTGGAGGARPRLDSPGVSRETGFAPSLTHPRTSVPARVGKRVLSEDKRSVTNSLFFSSDRTPTQTATHLHLAAVPEDVPTPQDRAPTVRQGHEVGAGHTSVTLRYRARLCGRFVRVLVPRDRRR